MGCLAVILQIVLIAIDSKFGAVGAGIWGGIFVSLQALAEIFATPQYWQDGIIAEKFLILFLIRPLVQVLNGQDANLCRRLLCRRW